MDKADIVNYALGIDGWMRGNELEWLSNTASRLPIGATWLEVGTWMGRSWAAAALSLPVGSTIICVDTFMGEADTPGKWCAEHGSVLPIFQSSHADVCRLRPDLETRIIVSTSVEGAKQVPDYSCDVIFIDACHATSSVRDDIAAWLPKIAKDGLMCGHDGDDPNVLAALEGLKYTLNPSMRGSIWCLQ